MHKRILVLTALGGLLFPASVEAQAVSPRDAVHRAVAAAEGAAAAARTGASSARISEQAEESPPPDSSSDPAAEKPEVTAEEMRMLQESLQTDRETDESPAGQKPATKPAPDPPVVQQAVQSMNPEISVILNVAGAWFSEEPLQTGAHDPSETGFNFQQLEMAIGASVDPYFRFDANLVFARFGVEVEEAYATTLALPASLQVRAGQFLTDFGRLNPTHPHSWAFLDQPLVNGKFFGGEGSRGVGSELSWLSPLPWYVEVIGSATDAAGECCARSFFGANDPGVDGPEDLLYTTAIEQFFPFGPEWSLLWGISAQFGPNATGRDNRTEIYGTDLYLRYRPSDSTDRTAVSLQIEGIYRTRQAPLDRLEDMGGYAQLVWEIDPRWETGLRYEFVTGIEEDPLDPQWESQRQRASAQVTFFPSHFSRIRLQGNWDAPEWRDDPILGAMLGLEVMVGEHGAHEF